MQDLKVMTQDAAGYQIMRFQIMAFALTDAGRAKITDAYVFAWDRGVYPIKESGAQFHIPFASAFFISEEMMDELVKYLEDHWQAKTVPTFYKLEDHYDVVSGSGPWERHTLISACRYLFLCRSFDYGFWATLLQQSQHPSEARYVSRLGDRDNDTYFTQSLLPR